MPITQPWQGGSLKQEPEDGTMGDEQEWYQDGWNEVGRTLHARREANARAIAFVEGMEQVCGAEKVKRPDQDDSQFVLADCYVDEFRSENTDGILDFLLRTAYATIADHK